MRWCDRCGIEMTSPGKWCADCVDVEVSLDNIWALRGLAGAAPEVLEQKARDIKDLWLNGFTDPQMADILGVNARTVLRWRKRLNLSATNHGGFNYMSVENQRKALARIPRMIALSRAERRANPRGPQTRFWEGAAYGAKTH